MAIRLQAPQGNGGRAFIRDARKIIADYHEGAGEGNPVYFRRFRVQQHGTDRRSLGEPESRVTHHQYLHRASVCIQSSGVSEELGFEVTILPVDHDGHISLKEFEEAIRPDTILVSTMYVNNEVGAVEPVEEISKIIKAKNPGPPCIMWMPFRPMASM